MLFKGFHVIQNAMIQAVESIVVLLFKIESYQIKNRIEIACDTIVNIWY